MIRSGSANRRAASRMISPMALSPPFSVVAAAPLRDQLEGAAFDAIQHANGRPEAEVVVRAMLNTTHAHHLLFASSASRRAARNWRYRVRPWPLPGRRLQAEAFAA